MTSRTSIILPAAALIAALSAPACSRDTSPPSGEQEAVPVTVATLATTDVAGTFEVGGIVQARTTATLTSRILAPVLEVRAVPGNRVRAGQVLIVLDGRDLAAQARRARAMGAAADQDIAAATADRQAAEAVLTLARATHGRIASLQAKGSATAQELDDATAALRAAEARGAATAARAQAALAALEGARAGSDAADTTETFSRITAPFDGVITEKMVEPGNMAAPGAPLMRLEDTRGFRLDVRVDESRIAQIVPGTPVPVEFDSEGDDAPRVVTGRVSEVGRALDADARAFLAKIALPADAAWRSGMFGRAHFPALSRRTLIVPPGALVQRGQVTSVFVVEQGIARLRLVSVSGNELLAGLADGDVVIVNPPPVLTDGRRVTAGGR